jgi:hypothetical protein
VFRSANGYSSGLTTDRVSVVPSKYRARSMIPPGNILIGLDGYG